MKKFIATSEVYPGEVHIIYGTNNLLMIVDFSAAELSPEQVEWLKTRIPTMYVKETFANYFSRNMTIVKGDYEITFEMFWQKYGRKINPKRCKPLWNALSQTNKVKAYHGISTYFAFLESTGFRAKADPQKYLTYKMWQTDWSKEK